MADTSCVENAAAMTHSSVPTAIDDPVTASVPDAPASGIRSIRGHEDGAIGQWLAKRRVSATGSSLDDVMGLSAAKREVQSLISRLRFPDRIREAGGELPRAVLFYGPPGTGKTTLARVVASALSEGSAGDVPFYELNGGDLTGARLFALRDHFVGRTPLARGYVVVFVDEVDAIALARHHYTHTPESRRALYALLAVLDGLRTTPNVLWLFTSNSTPSELDPAITRPGRIGWHVETTYPTATEREVLFRHLSRGRRFLGAEPDWAKAAEMMGARTSGAAIRQILDDAMALSLADTGDAATDWPHVVEAIHRRGHVSDRRQPLDERERKIVAAHEAGHALIATLLGLPLSQVVLDDLSGGGHTDLDDPNAHRATARSDSAALDIMAVFLAGTAAERLILDPRDVSLGSTQDLERATAWALARIDAGMDAGFPLLSRDAFNPQQPPSVRDMAASAAAATLTGQRVRVERLLAEHEPELRALARRVAAAEDGQLGGDELRRALLEAGLPDPGPVQEDPSTRL
ncbi:MAG: AAA family ATPase [Chloroflexi bacterium]|nr:AAA family ATPase [Chloroflexota bacterium]